MTASGLDFVPAHAKINLSLEVVGRREDGYHELASVMQTISLHDTLRFSPAADSSLRCVCDMDALATPDNLALRAANAVASLRSMETSPGLNIELHKEIPVQAGLGGGSSDAACVLTALNQRWRLELSAQRLEELGATLGSDVPFFIRGGTALITGRGERVQPLPGARSSWIVLAIPAVPVSTPRVFQSLTPMDFSTGAATSALVETIRAGKPLETRYMVNTLETRAVELFPAIADARDALLRAGAPFVRMSGSGSTFFAPFDELAEAARVVASARSQGVITHLTRTVSSDEIACARDVGSPGRLP